VHIATCDEHMRLIDAGALVVREGRIQWVGRSGEEPPEFRAPSVERHDLCGAWLTPGLIDCHTHLIFAGTRAREYAQRLRGATYAEIAARGGGILTTMRATRQATLEQLLESAAPRLEALLGEGVTTIEIKSGYGLTLEDEAKMLRAARQLARRFPVTVRTTLLAAHTLPPEFAGRPNEYIDTIAREWLPALHAEGLVDAVDVFCEKIAFSVHQAERLFDAALALGLPIKMHAEQLSNIGGTRLAASRGALSCDHLEYAGADEARAMASAGGGAAASCVLQPCRYAPASNQRAARRGYCDRHRHRLQSRFGAGCLTATGDVDGDPALRAHTGRGVGWRNAPRRARRGACWGARHARDGARG